MHKWWINKFRILINISLKFIPKGQFNKITALVQIIAWRQAKPEPMMAQLNNTHICGTRGRCVNQTFPLCLRYSWIDIHWISTWDDTFIFISITRNTIRNNCCKSWQLFYCICLPFMHHNWKVQLEYHFSCFRSKQIVWKLWILQQFRQHCHGARGCRKPWR